MDSKAINKAKARLRVARQQLDAAAKAEDHATFADSWYLFLVAAKNVYTQLEQGSKTSAQSRQWYGGIKQARKSDPLLQYLFQARDDDEHGIEDVLKHENQRVFVGANLPGASQHFRIDRMEIRDHVLHQLDVTPHDSKPFAVVEIPAHSRLAPVTGRGNVVYQPPTDHLGTPLQDTSPVAVGEMALRYLSGIIEEAEAMAA